ncbi:MAG: hypothetical protein KDD45_16185 [Bdellovibrionales bacterium]|nr:hypothetical protein [Bdellovibrionales bacterium]
MRLENSKSTKKRIVIVCPGRGSYTKETLGYLKKYSSKYSDFISILDQEKKKLKELTISELDQMDNFTPQIHTRGENASALIFACSYLDFLNIDLEKYEIVAVTGNSMGWYIALAVAGVLQAREAFTVINTMGSMMKEETIGGQIIYPITNPDWTVNFSTKDLVNQKIEEVNLIPEAKAYISIYLGGYLVIGGNQKALSWLLKNLPKIENYPFQLLNHAAFHTPLLRETSNLALDILSESLFQTPQLPLIDGRGHLWMPYSTDITELHRYTLEHQVIETYDFTAAITYSLKEFNPDHLVLLGPGNGLGGALGQILIQNHWQDMNSKNKFSERQKQDPFLISLGR